MKKSILLLPIIVLLAGCTFGTPSDSISSDGSVSVGPSDSITSVETLPGVSGISTSTPESNNTSIGSSVGTPSDTSVGNSSDTSVETGKSILEIREMATGVTPLVELRRMDVDYANYNGPTVTFNAKYLADLADNNHRLLQFADGTSSVGVAMTLNTFTATASKMNIGSCYQITGKVSIYLNRVEIIFVSYAASAMSTNIDLAPIAPSKTIGEAHSLIASLAVNDKGNGFDGLISIEAQYVAKADNAIMMFYDGSHIIQVHGDNYVNNGRTVGETWKLIVTIGRYQYKPSLEFVSGTRTAAVTHVVYNNPTPITSAQLRAKSIEDLDVYPVIYSFRGYVSDYVKDSSYFFGLVDNKGDRAHDVAAGQPNLSLRLKNHSNLYGNDLNYSVFVPYWIEDEIVETVFAIYMYNGGNTIKTWQIHSFDETVEPLENE